MISIMVAIANNNVIGYNNDLPWHYKKDLKYFKEVTTNHKVVMGRKTFNSIIDRNSKPLPLRENIVVTRNTDFSYPGVMVVNDFKKYMESLQSLEEEVFIIGGNEIFTESINYADRLYITHINKDYQGDVFFPSYNKEDFKLIKKEDDGILSFCVYERVK